MHSFAPIRTAAAVLALGALTACSSTPAPTEQMAVSRTTVNRVASAPAVATTAPVEMSQAREKLMQAEKAMVAEDYVTARRLAAEAEVDARIAARGLQDLQLYNGATHQALLAQPNFVRTLLAQPAPPIHRGGTLDEAIDPDGIPAVAVLPA